ncbi:MAG TPA: hypothetical protein VHL54_01120 [Actinomycetota bacterium]|nr:hypothetical protein [Actinomycetota bacterium]
MNNRNLALIAAVLAVLFLVLNFTMDAGTVFLILAVLSGVAAAYLFTKTQDRA